MGIAAHNESTMHKRHTKKMRHSDLEGGEHILPVECLTSTTFLFWFEFWGVSIYWHGIWFLGCFVTAQITCWISWTRWMVLWWCHDEEIIAVFIPYTSGEIVDTMLFSHFGFGQRLFKPETGRKNRLKLQTSSVKCCTDSKMIKIKVIIEFCTVDSISISIFSKWRQFQSYFR